MLSSAATELQNINEDHDDVDVEDHGTENVVIDAELVAALAHDKLGIEDEIDSEDKGAKCAQQHL